MDTNAAPVPVLPPIGAQLGHPDAWFYQVKIEDGNIVGLFSAEVADQPFSYPIFDFLGAAREEGIIDEFEYSGKLNTRKFVYIDNMGAEEEGTTQTVAEWLNEIIDDSDLNMQFILRNCAAYQADEQLGILRHALTRAISRMMSYDRMPENTEVVELLKQMLYLFDTHPETKRK